MRGEQTLSKVRTNVLLGSIYLRDALIDSASPRREYYRAELTRLRTEVEQSLTHVRARGGLSRGTRPLGAAADGARRLLGVA